MGFLQGNTYQLQVTLSAKTGLLDVSLISSVEFMIGSVRKLYPNDCTYDETKGCFYIPLTQEDTFSLQNEITGVQARVKFLGGSVKGSKISHQKVLPSISKAVL